MPEDRVSLLRKRKHRAVAQPQERNNKRRKPTPKCEWNSTTTYHALGFSDSLSKILLSRRALQEFDRRDALRVREAGIGASASVDLSGDLKRFARNGGPDLSDIGGVCYKYTQCFSPCLLLTPITASTTIICRSHVHLPRVIWYTPPPIWLLENESQLRQLPM